MSEKDKKLNKQNGNQQDDLTEEDLKKKDELDLLVTKTRDQDPNVIKSALEAMRTEIRTSTSSMTAIPKPLKFLRAHYDVLKEVHHEMEEGYNKKLLADLISVISMTIETDDRDTLKFRLLGTQEECSAWGHEYLRHLSTEIADEYDNRVSDNLPVDDIMQLVDEIVRYNVKHNAEPEACDLLLEVERLEKILDFIEEHNYQRVCLYLAACANYVQSPDDAMIVRIVIDIYRKMKQTSRAIQLALKLNDRDLIQDIFNSIEDTHIKRQIAFMLARNSVYGIVPDDSDDAELLKIARNETLSHYFKVLIKDLQITEAKEPEDIYKSHLSESRTKKKLDSAKLNLASTIVNAFLNAGSSTDKLMTVENSQWLYKNKEHGLIAAAASVGMIHIWDPETGTSVLDKFEQSEDGFIKAGYLLGVGISCANVVNPEYDMALNLLSGYLDSSDFNQRSCAALGLAIAYAGTNQENVRELLKASFENRDETMEGLGILAISLGLVCVGSCDDDLTSSILETIIERSEEDLKSPYARFLSLGLGLLYLFRKEQSEIVVETLKAAPEAYGRMAALTVDTLAYANSGNVEKVQKLLHECNEHLESDNAHQSIAVIGIALVAMSEEIGSEMVLRTFNHLLQYGEPNIRRAVPLALSTLCVGNPNNTVMDTLSKLSHDHDSEVAMGAILGLGMIGVGTNNSRIAQLLRQLATYYSKEPNQLYVVRLAQGLLHLGKGTITIRPHHSHNSCINLPALGALITVMHSGLDFKNLILGKSPHLMYLLSIAMRPRLLMCLDEDLELKPVQVRVGQAIDVVGQPGKPKTITGFQTNSTPVLLSHGDRAELATDQFLTYTDILEGFVIVKPNPDSKHKPLL